MQLWSDTEYLINHQKSHVFVFFFQFLIFILLSSHFTPSYCTMGTKRLALHKGKPGTRRRIRPCVDQRRCRRFNLGDMRRLSSCSLCTNRTGQGGRDRGRGSASSFRLLRLPDHLHCLRARDTYILPSKRPPNTMCKNTLP